MAKVWRFLGPRILALLGPPVRCKIQNIITNLPKFREVTDNYRFSNTNRVITAENIAFVQLANPTILRSLLLLCGDMVQNPGPSSVPTTKVRIHYKFAHNQSNPTRKLYSVMAAIFGTRLRGTGQCNCMDLFQL